jgi:TolB-like protein
MPGFWNRFRERKIAQWTLGYAAVAWLLREVVGEVGPAWGVSDAALRGLDVALLVGLLVTFLLAWQHGDRGRQRASAGEVALLLFLVVGGLLGVRAAARMTGPAPVADTTFDPLAAVEPYHASIAVLPFRGGGGTDGTHFEDGLAEELINVLGRVPALKVAARGSSFGFRGDVDPRVVAESLSVAHVLEGSVRRAGARVRVSITLVDASTGLSVWSESFDEELDDVFALQDSIARAIAGRLEVAFARGGDAAVRDVGSEAAELYMLGMEAWHRRSEAELLRSRDLFAEAARIEPDMARAFAGLALAYAVIPQYSGAVRTDSAVARTLAAAARAEALDPSLPEPHAARCQVAVFYAYEWDEGMRECREAIRLRPGYATAFHWYSELLMALGRLDEAEVSVERALELDPLAPLSHHHRAVLWELQGDTEAALRKTRSNLRRYPDFGHGRFLYPALLLGAGRFDEAADFVAANDGRYLPGGFAADTATFRAFARAAAAGETEAVAAAAHAMLGDIPEGRLRTLMALIFLPVAGDHERMWRILDDAPELPDPVALRLSAVRPLRSDPRFAALLRRYGLDR